MNRPFIHSVSLYSDQGLLLVSTEPDSSQMNLSDPALSPVWQVGMKRHLNDRHKEVKVLSYIRPFYNINSGRMLGYVELSIPETQISGRKGRTAGYKSIGRIIAKRRGNYA